MFQLRNYWTIFKFLCVRFAFSKHKFIGTATKVSKTTMPPGGTRWREFYRCDLPFTFCLLHTSPVWSVFSRFILPVYTFFRKLEESTVCVSSPHNQFWVPWSYFTNFLRSWNNLKEDSICWDITLCSPVKVNRCRLRLQGGKKNSVDIATGYGMDGRGLIPGKGKIFLFSIVSRGPPSLIINW
jgi:hypothetical protein